MRRDPSALVPGDAEGAEWVVDIGTDGGDFRRPAVHGPKGGRFVYLTRGAYTAGRFTMFRRAKLMLDDLPRDAEEVTVEVHVIVSTPSGKVGCFLHRPQA